MNGFDTISVNASMAGLHQMQDRLTYARKAERLLNEKAKSLHALQRNTAYAIMENSIDLDNVMKNAFMSLATAKFADSDFASTVEENLPEDAHIRAVWHNDVHLGGSVQFDSIEGGPEPFQLIGLATGAHQLTLVRIAFFNALEVLVKRISLNNAFTAIEIQYKKTWRKYRVIERYTIPRILNTIKQISNDLDDQEREEMFKINKIKKYRERKTLLRQRDETKDLFDRNEFDRDYSLSIMVLNTLYRGLMICSEYLFNFIIYVIYKIQNRLRNMHA